MRLSKLAVSLLQRIFARGVIAVVLLMAMGSAPLGAVSGCRTQRATTEPYQQQRTMFGTLVTIKVDETATPRVKNTVARAFAEMARVEKLTNNYDPNSAISRLNAQKTTRRKTSPELARIIEYCLIFAQGSGGGFEPTIWPVTKLWGFGRQEHVPTPTELGKALALVDARSVRLPWAFVPGKRSGVVEMRPGMGIDLGAVAKGYAVDRAVDVLRRAGIRHALVTTGSTTAVFGGRRNSSPWKIGIENPRAPGETIGVISLKDGAVSTSGDYQNYFVRNGVRYHHVLDPKTGMPARKSISATVIHPWWPSSDKASPGPGMVSDIFSTAEFVVGFDAVAARSMKPEDMTPAAVFVTPDRRVHAQGDLKSIVSGLPARI